MKAYFIIILSVFSLCILFFALKSHKFFKTLIFNAFLGICILVIIDLTAEFTGIYIPVNPYTVGAGASFGVPAITLLLVLQILI